MFYMVKTAEYLKILADEEVKIFLRINFGEYFKSTRKNYILNYVEKKYILEKLLNCFIVF